MCGIAGIAAITFWTPVPGKDEGWPLFEPLERMVNSMGHRGPDDQGMKLLSDGDFTVGLGHTRLSILDLSAAGHQPMQVASGSLWISYNGELYNYRELREALRPARAEWQSQTDTEVILNAYRHWGTRAFERLRGMFAFALWDDLKKQLHVVRDHFGIKPLYYHATDARFLFASEVRTLLASGLVPRAMDEDGLVSFLRFGAVESPLTIIRDVKSLAPGHYLTVSREDGRLLMQERPYAQDLLHPNADSPITDRREAVEVLRNTLEESVRLHLASDVPLAAFLSGGIDSSAIVALMRQVAGERPKTFTVTFAEKEYSEGSYSREIARLFGTEHHEIFLSEDNLLDKLPQALSAMDQPTIDGVNIYVIAQAVKQSGITVALSGLGGDELFAGYPSFRRVERLRRLSAIPDSVRQATARAGQALFGGSVQQRKVWHLLAAGGTPHSAYTISRQVFSWEEISSLLNKGRSNGHRQDTNGAGANHQVADRLNAVSRYELEGYMMNMLLRDTDQMSMAHSLEVRVPFVDRVVVPYVLSLPGRWKVDAARPKPLLVDAVADLLPQETLRRPKMGFTLPFERWMRSALKPDLSETFASPLPMERLGLSEYGRKVWATFDKDRKKERWSRPWALYVLKKWCDLNGIQ